MCRYALILALTALLAGCKPRTAPAPCASDNVLGHANTSCTLGSVTVSFGDADSIYNPAVDCAVKGSGPVCPSQAELRLNQDPGPGTLLMTAQPNAFQLRCPGNCSMQVKIHYTVEGSTVAGPRLNAVGGSGPFDVIGLQWVAGSTGRAECNSSGCGGGANDPACQTAAPYCTVLGSGAKYAGGRQSTTATFGVSCGAGGCTTQVNTLGLHHG